MACPSPGFFSGALAFLLGPLFAAFIIGCTSDAPQTDDGILQLVATTSQAGDLASILSEGATNIEITTLMGPGVDPHLYQPTQGDIAIMNRADLIIYSGLHLEGQFSRVFEALREREVIIHALSTAVQRAGFVISSLQAYAATQGSDDPHFWFDPRNWGLATDSLANVLAETDPAQRSIFEARATEYKKQLASLYTWAEQGMQLIPPTQRYLVSSHDAFQYFGTAFGWQMAAIQGLSTKDAAGVGDIQGTVNFVLENNIPVLFVESSLPPDTIEAVIEAVEAEGGTISAGIHELFSDAMGAVGSFGGTYIGMIAHNVYTILHSYRLGGVDIVIPPWPEGLFPQPPAELVVAK